MVSAGGGRSTARLAKGSGGKDAREPNGSVGQLGRARNENTHGGTPVVVPQIHHSIPQMPRPHRRISSSLPFARSPWQRLFSTGARGTLLHLAILGDISAH